MLLQRFQESDFWLVNRKHRINQMLKWRHFAFVTDERHLPMLPSATLLKDNIKDLTEAELQLIQQWDTITKSLPSDVYSQYSSSELAIYLGMKTGFSCKLTPISSVFGGKLGKQALVAYYMIKGYEVWYPRHTFTSEQRELIDYKNGLVVVNAGAGCAKTTTAVERALALKHEGVIIISYSNEAIREVHRRFKEYSGHRGQVGFKEFRKANGEPYPIVVTTVDSLAWFITSKGRVGESETSHASCITDAISAVSYGNCPPGKHIIVDEAQDIDEGRGMLLKLLYASGLYTSMIVFGDPRQRISPAGVWYSELWTSGSYTTTVFKRLKTYAPTVTQTPPEVFESRDILSGCIDINLLLADDEEVDPIEAMKTEKPMITKSITAHPGFAVEGVTCTARKFGMTITHRFKNQRLLDIHNQLSAQRPTLHVELRTLEPLPDLGPIRCYNVGDFHEEKGIVDFAGYLKTNYIDTKYCSLSDICIIIPSISTENSTSKRGQRLCAIFKDTGLHCYTRKEGSFLPNGILITTIHSVKGKEFKVVILYAMSEFPRWYRQIPYEVADSLVYVANTRAKMEMIYLCNTTFGPPRGVPQSQLQVYGVTLTKAPPSQDILMTPRPYGVTEMVESHGFTRLLEVNAYTVSVEANYESPKIPEFDVGNDRIRGVIAGLIVQTLVTMKHSPIFDRINQNQYFTLDTITYATQTRKGGIHGGVWLNVDDKHGWAVIRSDGINGIRPEEIVMVKEVTGQSIKTLGWKEWCLLGQIFDFVCGDHMNSRYDLKIPSEVFDFEAWNLCSQSLIKAFGPGEAEIQLKYSWMIGSCDLIFPNAIIELKTTKAITSSHRLQAFVYSVLHPNEMNSYVYNLSTGLIEKIRSPQHKFLWKYIIDAYGTIKNHLDLTTSRKNRRIEQGVTIPEVPNVYVADTEFEASGIFDFAMVNLRDPFSSIVQPLYSLSDFSVKWLSQHHKLWTPSQLKVLFAHAKKYGDLTPCFGKLGSVVGSLVMYYKAREDVAIPQIYGMKGSDLSSSISKLAATYGTSTEAVVSARLGEIYDLLVQPLQFQPHLHQHSALTDALILYELFHLGFLH